MTRTIGIRRDRSDIIINPYALPLNTKQSGMSKVQSGLKKAVQQVTQNTDFKLLLIQYNENKRTKYLKGLTNCEPCPAKVLSTLFSISAYGQIDEFM